MKSKWYRANITKGILIILTFVAVVVGVASAMWLIAYPAAGMEAFRNDRATKYEDSAGFVERIKENSARVIEGVRVKALFEKGGKYDADQLIDLSEYRADENYESSGEAALEEGGGPQYRLGDLIEWYKLWNSDESVDSSENLVVCEKTDGTYYYYDMSDFQRLFVTGELQVFASENEYDQTGYLQENLPAELGYGYSAQDMDGFRGIWDKDGKMLYTDCWLYDGECYEEKFAPAGADSLIDFVNNNPKWNGKLEDVYIMLRDSVWGIGYDYDAYENLNTGLSEGETNFSYIFADVKNEKIYTNRNEYSTYAELGINVETIKKSGKYIIGSPQLEEFETNMDISAKEWNESLQYAGIDMAEDDFIFMAAVDTSYPIEDSFHLENELFEKYGTRAGEYLVFGIVSIVLCLVCIVWLVLIAGRNNRDEELHLIRFDRWITEVSAIIIGGLWLAPAAIFGASFLNGTSFGYTAAHNVYDQLIVQTDYVENSIPYIIATCVLAVFTCGMFLIGLLSLARRAKARLLWKNSLLRKLCLFVREIVRNINIVWKTVLAYGAFAFLQLLFVGGSGYINESLFAILIVANAVAFTWLIYEAIGKNKIKEGIEKIAAGEVEYQIPSDKLKGEQRIIAEKINTIGKGLDAAVEKSMKSERLKTDLITNVSHDIKTPLTSIINYVELLKQENFEDPKIQRYIEVLEQKSQRLKTLTEDVVEASKVSSGNITLEYMNVNLVEMIQQTSGEFEEKFQKRNLKEVLRLPEEDALIRVDGRRTWRILENLYNNAAKYAMEGTRVYGDLTVDEQTVIFSLKNISEQPLNISADELTERFIRGDISRSTEGSGLGLSIAKTLTKMQGGTFELYLDGDLFKATISFPRVK